jgi:trigger factor
MKVKMDKAGGCRRVLQVEVGQDGVAETYASVVESFCRVARIPGFRPGKAPAVIVQRRYAKEIDEEARDRILPRLYREAVADQKLAVAAVVDVADVKIDHAAGISFKVTVDVEPEIKLPKYRKLSLADETRTISTEDVDQALMRIRERASRFEDVRDRVVKRGDLVRIDYKGTANGRPLSELCPDCAGLGEAKDFWALVDEPEFLPGATRWIEGMGLGETRKVPVTFPGDHAVEAVRGVASEYEVSVKAIRQRILQDLDDAFLKTLGFETVEKLRERIRSDLETEARSDETSRRKDEIAKFLLENVGCELPEAVVARETDHTTRSMVRRFAYQGATRDQIEQKSEEILGAAHRSSSDRVKLGFILKRIANEEKVEVSEEEILEHMKRLASLRRQTVEQVRKDLDSQDSTDAFRESVRAEKTMDFLVSIARMK